MPINLPARYTKKSDLPGGGMSDVCICEDTNLVRKVVVKAVKGGVDPAKLLDELQILSSIRSRYVVQVFDVVRDASGNIVGIVEEYLEGASLSPVTATDGQSALRSLYPIVAGIAEIHRNGCVHRDLKPDNMKHDANGQLKIFDFGLSKDQANAQTGNLFFTKFYAAPEIFVQNANGQHEFTTAADIFAFGVIALWTLNAGQLPSQLGEIPPNLPCPGADFAARAPYLPQPVIDALNSCLSPNPLSRPSGEDLEKLIKRYILEWQHKMTFTYGGKAHQLDKTRTSVKLKSGPCAIEIKYDGLDFVITSVSGNVRINNQTVQSGRKIEGSTVIVMRDAQSPYPASITANVSHPEVTA